MAYYIISHDPDLMGQFQARHTILKNAVWVKDYNQLKRLSPDLGEDAYLFVHTKGPREELDEMVLTVRETSQGAKIIYIKDSDFEEKTETHKMTPVGGDSYVSFHIPPEELTQILRKLRPPELNPHANRLENQDSSMVMLTKDGELNELTEHPKNKEIDAVFAQVLAKQKAQPRWQSVHTFNSALNDEFDLESGDDMSDKDQDLPLDDLGDLEITDEGLEGTPLEDAGLDLSLDEGSDLDLSEDPGETLPVDEGMDLSLSEDDDELMISDDEDLDAMSLDATSVGSLAEDDISEDLGELSFGEAEATDSVTDTATLGPNDQTLYASPSDLGLGGELDELDFGSESAQEGDLSDSAKEKLKEIDAIMDHDASQASISVDVGFGLDSAGQEESQDQDLNQPLVSDDLDLDSLSFTEEAPKEEDRTKRRKKEVIKEEPEFEEDQPTRVAFRAPKPAAAPIEAIKSERNLSADLKEISGAYTGELERTQATISNLRADREELLDKIQKLEEEKVLQSRQSLNLRAELDEKKIELSIIRKKLNEEISELKDRLKVHDEKRLILEEKNRVLMLELDKASQKNKIDLRKVQQREKELEQKLELLKSDAETQIRNRDQKILELKRKIDSMEFDMESITTQERRSVESRFELEDKLDKAIKTLRSAISVLEDESEKSGVLEALKKNIDM